MNAKFVFAILIVLFSFSKAVQADDSDFAPLDPAPSSVVPILPELMENNFLRFDRPFFDEVDGRSNLVDAIANQTSVKSQGVRGTCSIFSAIAMVESLIKIEYEEEVDLSENFLEFVIMDKMKSSASEGSSAGWNIPATRYYGAILEETWPYEIYNWEKDTIPAAEKKKRDEMCGEYEDNDKKICILSHLEPGSEKYDQDAAKIKGEYELADLQYRVLYRARDIKRQLRKGVPVILGLEFFYGAWNHRLMPKYDIGERDMEAWANGVVSTPTNEDRRLSRKHPAGHSILVVGYDDAKKVYYFKNSWGQHGFGRTSSLIEDSSTAGYGTITYGYAHNYGTFYRVNYR